MKKTIAIGMAILLAGAMCACEATAPSAVPTASPETVSTPEARPTQSAADPNGSDPGDTLNPEWWGTFKGDAYSVGIVNFNGTSFSFEIYRLSDGVTVYDGVAALYPDNPLMAEYGVMSFSLYEDYSAIDIFAPESSEYAPMRGRCNRE